MSAITMSASTTTVEAFSAGCDAFLRARLEPRAADLFEWGKGDDSVTFLSDSDPDEERAAVQAARSWAAERFDGGYGWIDGPVEYGGAGLTARHARAYRLTELRYNTPDQSFFIVGVGIVAPTLIEHGTEEQKRDLLPRLYRGDIVACELFSEPGAGSDLASVATTARRDGDQWVVSGQKVWTSHAHVSDVGLLLCRTTPGSRGHNALSMFLIDMKAPGIEVRPLREMAGGTYFNEVFLDDVAVPDDQRIGPAGDGWKVAVTALAHERANGTSSSGHTRGPAPFRRMIDLLRRFGDPTDPVARQQLVGLYIENELRKRLRDHLAGAPGAMRGAGLSLLKLHNSRYFSHIADFAGEVLGARAIADTGDWGTFAWHALICTAPAAHIGGGSDEILLNLIGERVLGLPREPSSPSERGTP